MTMTELLTVVSVITILTSMMSPVLSRVHQEGSRIRCVANLKQVHVALELVAHQRNGKFPRCFDLTGANVREDTWWYRRVAQAAYPTDTVGGTFYDQLTVPRSNDPFWNGDVGKLTKFNPQGNILRCPASRDNYWDHYAPGGSNKVTGGNAANKDKDRVYDDSYGYNNYNFAYAANYGGECNIHWKIHTPRYIGTSTIYHTEGPRKNRSIRGSYVNNPASPYTHLGALSDMAEPAQTLLIVDYIKADVAPTLDFKTMSGEFYDGYMFRHGGKLNALFCDGHIDGFRERMFRRDLADGLIHWEVKRP